MTTDLTALLSELDLETKVRLLTGADFWTTVAVPEIGLRSLVLSDGPSGVRGPAWDERSPSLNLPNATSLAAAWDPGLAYAYGAAVAAEARRKGVDIVLGPTINLHRSPLGGRTFEAFSEDPHLTGELAVAYVRGLQDNGVGACPKHYVGNDSETDRFTVDVQVSDRTLRELYLAPFECAVIEGHAWTIMSSYNSVNGTTVTENDLLETPLKSEWGFDGVVISDWTAVRSLASARAAQDLVMPGPDGPWGDALVLAVRTGDIPEEVVDRKVLRLLTLAERVGALGDTTPAAPVPLDGPAFARAAAVEGTVLLSNDGILPLSRAQLSSVAVIGQNARDARTQGGGSATVLPEHVVSPLDGLRAVLPDVPVTYAIGAVVSSGVVEIPVAQLTNPRSGEPGLITSFLDADGAELFAEDRRSTGLVWIGGDAPIALSRTIRLHTTWTPATTEDVHLGFATSSPGKIWLDGELVVDATPEVECDDLGAAFLSPPSLASAITVEAGRPIELIAEFTLARGGHALDNAFAVTLGLFPAGGDPEQLIAEAAAAAREADVAIVVVGTSSKVESEGFDRSDLDLPGRQDDLVRAVAAANPRTVVVVNAGAPVLMPWRDEVAAVLVGHFGGQEFGAAIADVLLGDAEPGGRLTSTWPAALEDVPVLGTTPTDGALEYSEGIHVGYRAWDRADATPAFAFGSGQGYTTWSLDGVAAEVAESGDVRVTVDVTNTGDRSGKQVVQVFADMPGSAVDRPVRWLVGFAPVRARAGEASSARVTVAARAFQHWTTDGWASEPGDVVLHVGTAVDRTPLTARVTLP
jgi:beta-glucosidase